MDPKPGLRDASHGDEASVRMAATEKAGGQS